ncbi:MAG: hypothetical protein HeimC2_22670 [Candidatus Heimdallarchaeota archaeon LC_2]|nr:MAG: hypothetical protein HeimC2_22670 [Candidatus Heimdallarchaeota archaeon LC_2]
MQLESKKRELDRTLNAIKDLEDESEVYRSAGQILFKTNISDTRKSLSEDLELLDVRVIKSKKQIEDLDKRVKDKEEQIRATIQ